ncbi:MAG: guanylyltransferase [Lachnospiraceae bacterium]|nr:guanylyltransferase [Lachnospiraceae bacterium]
MRFDDLDKKMRVYEKSLDQVITPETYMIARLDGRGFTKLTKEVCKYEAPFDIRFRDSMIKTVEYLMDCGFRVIYGFTESDEISLLFDLDENTFGRKVRKYNSTLAGEASAVFSLDIGRVATFDCRIIPLPNIKLVEKYFLWRQEDAHRNSLNSYCYWTLRKQGKSKREATRMLEGKSVAFKNELLFSMGINYDKVPSWQKRGVGILKEEYEKEGFNPVTGEKCITTRKRNKIELELPLGSEYATFISSLI